MADTPEAPELVKASEATTTADTILDDRSPRDRLKALIAQATALYAVKDYSPASELYAQAAELQAELNGEMAIENADLLYTYGKCLYFVAVRNSEVLGVASAGTKLGPKENQPQGKPSKRRKLNGHASKVTETKLGDHGVVVPTTDAPEVSKPDHQRPSGNGKADSTESKKPYFNITGDENWDDSDEEVEEEPAEDADREGDDGDDEEDQDDFSLAFEVLDLSRVLLLRKLETLQQSTLESSKKGKYVASIDLVPEVREVKERIADVHDFQSEISLEGERYLNAVQDLRSALALKEELYPLEHAHVAECHYKLSLALEFGSKSQKRDEEGNPVGEAEIDESMREESITEMGKAIDSCQRRIKKEQLELDNLEAGPRKDKAMKEIDEVREMVEELEQRLTDLKAGPVDAVQEAQKQDELASGLLKELLGSSKEEAARKLAAASSSAKDLSGMVRKKKQPKVDAGPGSTTTSGMATPEPTTNGSGSGTSNGTSLGKRKVAFADESDAGSSASTAQGKKARVEDAEDDGR